MCEIESFSSNLDENLLNAFKVGLRPRQLKILEISILKSCLS